MKGLFQNVAPEDLSKNDGATDENPETQDEKLEHTGKALRRGEQGIVSSAYLRSRVHQQHRSEGQNIHADPPAGE
jgi:hypothetical protein